MAYLENGVLRSRPRHFFSQRLHRWSLLAQHPSLMTWREFCLLIFFLYFFYEAYFTVGKLRTLLWRRGVEQVCGKYTTGMDCFQLYMLAASWEILQWLGKGLTWLPVALVVIFVGEESIFRRK